jgi:hypothetical protein
MVILDHVGRLQVFVIDRVVRPNKRQRRLMVKVLSLAAHCLMRLGEQDDCLAPPIASLLAP